GVQLERAVGGARGAGVISGFAVQEGEMRQRYRHVGALTDDLFTERDRTPKVATLIPRDDLVDLAVERHQALWIVCLGVARLRRRRSGEITEAAETLAGFGALRRLGRTAIGCAELSEECLQLPHVLRARRRQVPSLGRIGSDVVQLGNRQIDVLERSAGYTVQRRP